MNKDVIAAKIEIIIKTIGRIKTHIPASSDELAANYDAQDIIALNLERTIQASVDIAAHIISATNINPPQTMSDSFICLEKGKIITKEISERMRKAVGFRNISVHDYQVIDWNIVYSICTKNLRDFEEFIRQIVEYSHL